MLFLVQLGLVALVSTVGGTPQSARQSTGEKEVAGVRLAETVRAGDKTLVLNGAGLRTKTIFKAKVYVAGLYLERPSRDAAGVIASEAVKRVELTFLRELDRKQIGEAIAEGFERNSKKDMPKLKARLDQLCKLIPDMKKRDELEITYLPGKGTVVSVKGTEQGVIEGKDFADALFSVWLGRDPVDKDLKDALLGK